MTETMKAFGLHDKNATAELIEVPFHEPGPGEVRVSVRASSVNGWDRFVASGMARDMMEHHYPVVVGKDFAGVVDAVGGAAERFAVGDQVVGITAGSPILDRNGSYAEYLIVEETGFIEPKREAQSFEQAASIGLAALSAQVCIDRIEPSEGQMVLIVGASGGVGAYAVQLAAARGALVIATGLEEDETLLGELGAAEIVDYTGDLAAAVRELHPDGVDAMVVAAQVGDGFSALAELVRDGGRIASLVGGADVEALAERNVTAANVAAQAETEPFARVVQLANDGAISIPITETHELDDAAEALGLHGKRHARGKTAIRIPERPRSDPDETPGS